MRSWKVVYVVIIAIEGYRSDRGDQIGGTLVASDQGVTDMLAVDKEKIKHEDDFIKGQRRLEERAN